MMNNPECPTNKSEIQAYIDEADEQLNEMLKELDFRVKKIKTCLDEAEGLVG